MAIPFIGIAMLFLATFYSTSSTAQVKLSTVDQQALTIFGRFSTAINGRTFQKDGIASYNGYQYIVFYDHERHVCLSRRKLPIGNWETLRFTDYKFESNDAHNVISMGICPKDGTIHLAFDHHVHPLHYRVSKKGLATHPESEQWSTNSFGSITSELEKGKPIKITYPKFWTTPEGNLQFNYRIRGSGDGDRMLVDYDATTGKWQNTRQIDSSLGHFEDELGTSDSRCSYPNGYDYDKNGTLHVTWVWRENSQGANHDLMYVYSEDGGFTWKNNEGELLNEIPQVNSPGIVVHSIPRVFGLMNDHGQVLDSKGRVHVTMYHSTKETIEAEGSTLGETRWGPPAAKRYHHYWRDQSGKWHHFQMELEVGNRPKIFADKNDNLFMIYIGNPIQGKNRQDLIVAAATAKENWKDWHIEKVVEGPFMNDAIGDIYRWKSDGILSVMVQDEPISQKAPSKLSVVDLSFDIQ